MKSEKTFKEMFQPKYNLRGRSTVSLTVRASTLMVDRSVEAHHLSEEESFESLRELQFRPYTDKGE